MDNEETKRIKNKKLESTKEVQSNKKTIKLAVLIIVILLLTFIVFISISASNLNNNPNNDANNQGELNNEENPSQKGLRYGGLYTLFRLNDGKKAFITLYKNGKCIPTFSMLNICATKLDLCVYYNYTYCNYKIDSDNIITIETDLRTNLNYYYYIGSIRTSSVIQSVPTMKNIKLKYFEEIDGIDLSNGKWEMTEGEGFYLIFFQEQLNSVENDENNSNQNNNNNNQQDNNDIENNEGNIEDEQELERKNIINDIFLKVDSNDDGGYIYLSLGNGNTTIHDSYLGNYISSYKFNGKNYQYNDKVKVNLDKAGQNCYSVEVFDIYGQSRIINKCYDFTPQKPKLKLIIDNCKVKLWTRTPTTEYNKLPKLKIYYDNTVLSNDMYTYIENKYFQLDNVSIGTHTLKITNMYGSSTEVTFNYNNECSDYQYIDF